MTDGNPNPKQMPGQSDVAEPMSVADAAELTQEVIENIERVIVGKRTAAEHILTTVLARGHLLLEDVPGVGKTMLARSVARSIDCSFRRVQFTPDLLPSDITGVNVFNQKNREFEFQPGPVFANIVLGDEINRAPPKTQSALLEAMEEEQVTVDGETYQVPQPFTVIATQNAVERDRTYDLPIAEVDRFMKQITIGYPESDDESEVLRRVVGTHPIDEIEAVTSADQISRARKTVSNVTVEAPIREYATSLANYTREHANLGVSPRGAISLVRAAQARAVLEDREYVIPDDIKREAYAVLSHRIRREANQRVGQGGEELVEAALENVPVE
ncbi:MAG: AAA family ATPase [Halobacteriales archaeon]